MIVCKETLNTKIPYYSLKAQSWESTRAFSKLTFPFNSVPRRYKLNLDIIPTPPKYNDSVIKVDNGWHYLSSGVLELN